MQTIARLKPSRLNSPFIRPTQIIFHSAGDNYGVEGHLSWQWNGDLESHAYTARDGRVYQIVPYNRRAQANYTANLRPDGTGALSMETGSSINATEPWTDDQIDSLVEWSRERISEFPAIARQRCPGPNAPGLGYHIMFGTPGAWTPVAKACPGPERIKQFNGVLLPRIIKDGPTVIDLGRFTPAKEVEDMALVSQDAFNKLAREVQETNEKVARIWSDVEVPGQYWTKIAAGYNANAAEAKSDAERDQALAGAVAALATAVRDIQTRILTPGAPYDHIQDLMNIQIPTLNGKLDSIAARLDKAGIPKD